MIIDIVGQFCNKQEKIELERQLAELEKVVDKSNNPDIIRVGKLADIVGDSDRDGIKYGSYTDERDHIYEQISQNDTNTVNAYLNSLPGETFEERDEAIYQDFCKTLDAYTIDDYKENEEDAQRIFKLMTELKPSEKERAFATVFCVNLALSSLVAHLRDAREKNFLLYKGDITDASEQILPRTTENLEKMFARYEEKLSEKRLKLAEQLLVPKNTSTLKAKANAEEIGAIMNVPRLSFPSNDIFRDAFNPRCIFRLHDGEDDECDDNGQLQIFGDSKPLFDELDDVHTAFLALLLSINDDVKFDDETRKFTLYAPSLCRSLKIDPRAKSTNRAKDKTTSFATDQTNYLSNLAKKFDRLFGRIGNTYYRVLSIDTIDYENYLITLNAPYIYQLKCNADKQYLGDRKPPYNKLIHSDVMNRDQTALALASRILNGILQRGNTVFKSDGEDAVIEEALEGQMEIGDFLPDAKRSSKRANPVVYMVKWQTLIDDIPQLKSELETINKSSSKDKYQKYNKKLQGIFTQAFDIIEHHSDAPTTWQSFTIPKHKAKLKGGQTVLRYNLPTRTTTQTKLKITHYGRVKTDS